MRNVWFEAQKLQLNISSNIKPGFDYSFDKNVKKDIKAEMLSFMKWIEDSYGIPITIRIDFLYKNYLINRSKRRVGFSFYWSDFVDYPLFYNTYDIPIIELPVRADSWSIDEILTSFIEAMTYYYCWLLNIDLIDCDLELADLILNEYKNSKE